MGYFLVQLNCCTKAAKFLNNNLMDWISDLKTEGLFRKTGNVARQRLLKEWLNEGVDLILDQESFTPHDCATVLKNYLSELPDPLLTERHYQAHLQVVGMLVVLCMYSVCCWYFSEPYRFFVPVYMYKMSILISNEWNHDHHFYTNIFSKLLLYT